MLERAVAKKKLRPHQSVLASLKSISRIEVTSGAHVEQFSVGRLRLVGLFQSVLVHSTSPDVLEAGVFAIEHLGLTGHVRF